MAGVIKFGIEAAEENWAWAICPALGDRDGAETGSVVEV